MPRLAKRPCSKPGCRVLVTSGCCPKHAAVRAERERERKAEYEKRRPPRSTPTSDPKWRGLRVAFLRRHPLCAECGGPATEVHHRIAVRVRPDLALEWSNLIALCASDHARITAREGGAYGNPTRGDAT